MECIPLSALRVGHREQCIRARASRLWHHRTGFGDDQVTAIHMVLIDEEGDSIYAVVPSQLAASNINILHESAVYELSLFQVSTHEDAMNPVEKPLVIMFTKLTIVQLIVDPNDMFQEWTYRLTSFADLPEPSETPRQFLDVIGVIRGISDVATLNLSGSNNPVSRRHILLSDKSGNQIRVTLWGEAAFRFNGQVIRFLGQGESAVVIFVGTTVHSHEGYKELAGAAACRWYINVDIQDINILRASFQSSFQPIEQLPAPYCMKLQAPVNAGFPVHTLSSILSYDLVANQGRAFRCDVKIWRLTPARKWWFISCVQCGRAATPIASMFTQADKYTCSDIGCPSTDVVLRYRLHLLGSDGTGEAEFTLLGRIAQNIIGVSPRQTILNNYRTDVPVTNLALAATQITHTPPELAAVVSRKYRFLVSITANSFREGWASFNVRAVEACYPPE